MSSKAQPETPSLPQEYGEAAHNVPPLVRLQAWYFSKAGKSIESNRALVKSLSHLELSGWLMQPTHSSSHGKHRRDEFVPVEVDFIYQPSSQEGFAATPEELIRVFFHNTLPPIIQDFFAKMGKEAHYVTMFPIAEHIDRSTRDQYTHCRLLHSLTVDPQIVSEVMHQVSNADKRTRGLAYKAIGTLPLKYIQGSSLSDGWLAIGAWLSEKTAVKPPSKSQRRASDYTSSAAPECYRELEKAFDLATSWPLEPGARAKQDMYLMVTQMAVAFQMLPFYRYQRDLYMQRFINSPRQSFWPASTLIAGIAFVFLTAKFDLKRHELFKMNYLDGDVNRYALWRVASILWIVFSILVALVLYVEYVTLNYVNQSADKKINKLRVAQSLLVGKFCLRVLKMPPKMMTLTEREEILYGLGVNLDDETFETRRQSLEAFLAKGG